MRFLAYFFKSILSALGFKFCEYCGSFLRGDARKCSDCGSIVRDADVFSWGWCAVGVMLSPVGLIAAIVFLFKKSGICFCRLADPAGTRRYCSCTVSGSAEQGNFPDLMN